VPKILGLEGHQLHQGIDGWDPIYLQDNLAVMSIGFLLGGDDEAVIWRGPKKNGVLFVCVCVGRAQGA
jgi:Mrp family chromosome partitioning ATPase